MDSLFRSHDTFLTQKPKYNIKKTNNQNYVKRIIPFVIKDKIMGTTTRLDNKTEGPL